MTVLTKDITNQRFKEITKAVSVNHFDLFPTTVLLFKNIVTLLQCAQLEQLIKAVNLQSHAIVTHSSVSTHEVYDSILNLIADKLDFGAPLRDSIVNACIHYSSVTKFKTEGLQNSWATIQTQGSQLKLHTHPGSTLSGVLYIKVDTASSRIVFSNPNPFINFTKLVGKAGEPTSKYAMAGFAYKPEIGDMLIFPSWLSHSSGDDVNQSVERIILSFNAY